MPDKASGSPVGEAEPPGHDNTTPAARPVSQPPSAAGALRVTDQVANTVTLGEVLDDVADVQADIRTLIAMVKHELRGWIGLELRLQIEKIESWLRTSYSEPDEPDYTEPGPGDGDG